MHYIILCSAKGNRLNIYRSPRRCHRYFIAVKLAFSRAQPNQRRRRRRHSYGLSLYSSLADFLFGGACVEFIKCRTQWYNTIMLRASSKCSSFSYLIYLTIQHSLSLSLSSYYFVHALWDIMCTIPFAKYAALHPEKTLTSVYYNRNSMWRSVVMKKKICDLLP